MQTRSSFDDYLGLAGGVLLCLGLVELAVVLKGPSITFCSCPVYPNPCHCPQSIPMGLASALPRLPQVYLPVLLPLLALSLVVAVVGTFVGQRIPARIDRHLLRALQLYPLLAAGFLEVLVYILYIYPYPLPGVLPR